MQTPYKPPHPNDSIYIPGSNPIREFKTLNIDSSRPGGPTKDAPMYLGMVLTRNGFSECSNPLWEEHEMPETQEELRRKLSKWRNKSVGYDSRDMRHAAKRDEIDHIIKRENKRYPGYEYKLASLFLDEGRASNKKRVCTQMRIILRRQPDSKPKSKSQFEDPKQDLRDPYTRLPSQKPTQTPYGKDSFGYRNEDLKCDAGTAGIQYQPNDQRNRSQHMPIHAPENYMPPPPPPPTHPDLQFPPSPDAHLGEDRRFQTPHHEGQCFDGRAQSNRFPEPYLNNAGQPMQNPYVSFEDQQNHGGLGHHPDTQGSHHISRPRSGAGHHPITQEEYHRPHSGVGHHPNFQDEYNPRPRSGAGKHPNMQDENNNPRPVSRARGDFDGRDHHQTYPHGEAEERFGINKEFLNRSQGGGPPQFEEFHENQPHLHPQSKKDNISGSTSCGVNGAGRKPEGRAHRDSGFFSGESSDGGRSGYSNDQNFHKAYAEPRRKKAYPRVHQHDHQNDYYQSRNRSKDLDSDSGRKHGKHDNREHHRNFHRRGSHQSLDSAHDQHESDFNGRTAFYNKNRENRRNRRNSSRSNNKEYDDVHSNEYLTPGDDFNGRTAFYNKNRENRRNRRNSSRSNNKEYDDVHSNEYLTPGDDFARFSEDDSLHSSRGLGAPQTYRRSKRMPNVCVDDPRDGDFIETPEREQRLRPAKKPREAGLQNSENLKLDREREERRNGRDSRWWQPSGGTLPQSRWTHRQSDRY